MSVQLDKRQNLNPENSNNPQPQDLVQKPEVRMARWSFYLSLVALVLTTLISIVGLVLSYRANSKVNELTEKNLVLESYFNSIEYIGNTEEPVYGELTILALLNAIENGKLELEEVLSFIVDADVYGISDNPIDISTKLCALKTSKVCQNLQSEIVEVAGGKNYEKQIEIILDNLSEETQQELLPSIPHSEVSFPTISSHKDPGDFLSASGPLLARKHSQHSRLWFQPRTKETDELIAQPPEKLQGKRTIELATRHQLEQKQQSKKAENWIFIGLTYKYANTALNPGRLLTIKTNDLTQYTDKNLYYLPTKGNTYTLSTDVNLRDEESKKPKEYGKIIGILSEGTKVKIEEVYTRPTKEGCETCTKSVWARISLAE